MSNSPAVIARRVVITAIGTLGLLSAASTSSLAQAAEPARNSWEFRVTGGSFVPTGDQRNVLKSAQVTAAQMSWLVRPPIAITGTFAWARSRDLTSIDTPKLNVFTADLGVEARPAEWFGNSLVSISPFVGAGAGVRSYDYRKLEADATHNVAGYGAVGGELGIGRVGLRLEVRDYVTGFRPLVGAGSTATRNDVVFMAALRFNRQPSVKN